MRHDIFLLGCDVDDAHATTLLALVFIWIGALHVAALSEKEHGILVRHQVFERNVLHAALHDAGAAIVAIFLHKFLKFFLHHRKYLFR